MQLNNLAIVRSGLVLSRKLSNKPTKYRYELINLRSINADAYIDMNELEVYDAIHPLGSEYLTQAGDVLIRLSSPYTAVLIDNKTSGLIFSSNFVIVRADTKKILPEYLFWFINTTTVKKDILKNNSSNMLGAIRPKYFSNLDIELLPLEKQLKIGNFNLLVRRENELIQELAQEKKKYYQMVIEKNWMKMRKEN